MEGNMFNDEFKERYTTIPFAVYRAYFVNKAKEVIAHQHKEIEIISMTEGSAFFYVDAQEYRLEKGDILIIPPYAIHHGRTSEKGISSYTCICFDLKIQCDEELKNGLEDHILATKHLVSKESVYASQLQKYIEKACLANEKQASGWELEAMGNISLLMSILKKEDYFTKNLKCETKNSFAQKVMNYIIDHYTDAITSRTVADAFYMDTSYFCRLFKKNFGCCFADYVLAYRLEKAKLHLTHTVLPVTEIAFQTGFNSCSYFSKTFKVRFGISPLSYRKLKRYAH
jgi:AraC-like DNA-binding protein